MKDTRFDMVIGHIEDIIMGKCRIDIVVIRYWHLFLLNYQSGVHIPDSTCSDDGVGFHTIFWSTSNDSRCVDYTSGRNDYIYVLISLIIFVLICRGWIPDNTKWLHGKILLGVRGYRRKQICIYRYS